MRHDYDQLDSIAQLSEGDTIAFPDGEREVARIYSEPGDVGSVIETVLTEHWEVTSE